MIVVVDVLHQINTDILLGASSYNLLCLSSHDVLLFPRGIQRAEQRRFLSTRQFPRHSTETEVFPCHPKHRAQLYLENGCLALDTRLFALLSVHV